VEDVEKCEFYQTNISPVLSKNFNIKSVLYIGDNSDLLNFGCRATSLALEELVSCVVEVKDVVRRNELNGLFASLPLVGSILKYIQAVRIFNAPIWDKIKKMMENSDAVILNGEGSFNFQSPPRLDLYNYMVLAAICMEMNKPFFLLNCMFSGFAESAINEEQAKECFSLLRNATAIFVRDTTSLAIANKYTGGSNTSYVPDALFSWFSYYESKNVFFHSIHHNIKNLLPFYNFSKYDYDIDFRSRYILLSGNSYAAHFPLKGYKSFLGLTKHMRNIAEDLGLRLYLIECCWGDSFLRDVARDTKTPIIPVQTNVRYAGYVLGKAQCFVSGRYHPSILASLGGCPCVFMGSSSHKTLSLQNVLGIQEENIRIFDAIPDEYEAIRIVKYAEVILNSTDRAYIKKICERNENLAKAVTKVFQ
jgi:polysaccharide pyruvyl transferase WcaK-like protein